MNLPLLKNAHVSGKKVFVRLDLDVPLTSNRHIKDDTRLLFGLDTVKSLMHRGASLILCGHLGRPKGRDLSLSLEPVARWFASEFKVQSSKCKISEFSGWQIGDKVQLLENIRFYEEEEKNDAAFSKELASLADVYVNDAFSDVHRNHASIVGVPSLLPHFAGIRLEEEVRILTELLSRPKRPLCIIIGGAKIETKLPLVERMHEFADYVLVGGKIAEETKELLAVQHQKTKYRSALLVADLNEHKTDITEKSLENFLQIIDLCKTVVWNGPLGIIENSEFKTQESRAREADSGTQKVAERIIKDKVYSVAGGGDTLGFLKEHNLLGPFHFTSTGGGAMLAFLSGEKLPGLESFQS